MPICHASTMQDGGEYDQLLVAIYSAPAKRLHHLSCVIWGGHANGILPDEAANRLNEAIERRREFFRARGHVGAMRRRAATWSIAHPADDHERKRRIWSTGGALPNTLRSMFTPGENAVAGIIRQEVRRKGKCTLKYSTIAKAAGLRSTTVVKRFVRLAKRHNLIKVEERLDEHGYNEPNVITIISKEWLSWISYQGRAEPASKGGTAVPTDQRPQKTREKSERKELAKKTLEMMAAVGLGRDKWPPYAAEQREQVPAPRMQDGGEIAA